jgi:hypothetical protein
MHGSGSLIRHIDHFGVFGNLTECCSRAMEIYDKVHNGHPTPEGLIWRC